MVYKPQLDSIQRFEANGSPRRLGFGQGLIWRLLRHNGRKVVYHCGSVQGQTACLVIYPDEHLVASVLANRITGACCGYNDAEAFADLWRRE